MVVGVGVASLGVGIWLYVRALTRRRSGRNFGASGCLTLFLLLAGVALLVGVAAYVPPEAPSNSAAQTAVFHRPAPVDAGATVVYLSQAVETSSTSRASTYTYTLIGLAARTGAIRWQRALPNCQPALVDCRLPQYAVDNGIAYVALPATNGAAVAAYRGADGGRQRCGKPRSPAASSMSPSRHMRTRCTCWASRGSPHHPSRPNGPNGCAPSSRCMPPTAPSAGAVRRSSTKVLRARCSRRLMPST
ncbi:MAG TPA: hypothetical protein VGP82_19160 [Ktedonobacterales bacterium]|nr:hypothetical protein [Ktedonobacterales bacterium]